MLIFDMARNCNCNLQLVHHVPVALASSRRLARLPRLAAARSRPSGRLCSAFICLPLIKMAAALLLLRLLSALLPLSAASKPAAAATLQWSAANPLSTPVSPSLFSFTSDFHAPESRCHVHGVPDGEALCWRNASFLNADLTSSRLLSAVQHLSPAVWRIGGSPADDTVYSFGGKITCPTTCKPLVLSVCGKDVFDDEDTCKHCLKKHDLSAYCPASQLSKICKEGGDDAFYCLKPERWNEVLSFGKKAGAKVVFGLNYASQAVWTCNGERHDAHCCGFIALLTRSADAPVCRRAQAPVPARTGTPPTPGSYCITPSITSYPCTASNWVRRTGTWPT